MKFVKQSRETVPRNPLSFFRTIALSAEKILWIVFGVLFVPPVEQKRIEESRVRASELSGHFHKHGGF